MKNVEETINTLKGKRFNIRHPYADFTFTVDKPFICSGTLYFSVWDLSGKVSFNGDNWFDVDTLKPNEDIYIEYFYETIVNDFGWVYQDIYATIDDIIQNSVLRKFKILSMSNQTKPLDWFTKCEDVSEMDRKVLNIIEEARTKLSEEYDVKGLSISKEHIITIDIGSNEIPSIDLLEDEIPKEYVDKLFDFENGITYILNSIGIGRFCIGKIHKH